MENVAFWESLTFHAAWLAPLLAGFTAVSMILRFRLRLSAEAVTYWCFAWSVAVMATSLAGVFWNWHLLSEQVGSLGDVSWSALIDGGIRSCIPAIVGLCGLLGLFALATVLRSHMKR